MISDIEVKPDDAGFPIVAWTESRGLSSPEGPGRARVECRIMKDGTTGVLLFVARGSVRHGAFEEGKPWEALKSFSFPAADSLYYTGNEQRMRQHLAGKGLGSKMLWSDDAHVMLAQFAGDTSLHINCADASPVDLERLHVTLTRTFLNQDQLAGALCKVMFQWPLGDDRVMTYDPNRQGWPGEKPLSRAADVFAWVIVLAIVGAVGALVLWAVGVL